ncbi:Pentatricopeptide repeat-containing protein [Nymphaea thermarum]|nr:Pentatricopeptide repeat-containing protein [Nymphaea thermarum]
MTVLCGSINFWAGGLQKLVCVVCATKPASIAWEAVLGCFGIHGNMELGIQAAERQPELRRQHDGRYVLLSNMYVAIECKVG